MPGNERVILSRQNDCNIDLKQWMPRSDRLYSLLRRQVTDQGISSVAPGMCMLSLDRKEMI